MQKDTDIPGISCGLVNDNNIFEWEVMLMIPDEVKYYGGSFLLPETLVPLYAPSHPSPFTCLYHFFSKFCLPSISAYTSSHSHPHYLYPKHICTYLAA